VIFLRVPAGEAHRRVGEKDARSYTKLRRDLQEADVRHLEGAAEVYDELARRKNWVTIECYDAAGHSLRTPGAIHEEIVRAIDARIFSPLRAKG